MNYSDYLYVEKFRPKLVSELILPEESKKLLNSFIDKNSIPNLLFSGSSGTGKTSAAYALANELKYDLLFINGSNEGRSIETFRGVVTEFASSLSLYANRKIVLIDEADGMPILVQDNLRAFIETYSSTCSFILTCNHKSKLSQAILSRLSEVNFTIPSDQKNKISVAFMKRVVEILKAENIKFDNIAVAELVKRYFPDFRRCLTELQRYSSGGEFTSEQLKNLDSDVSQMAVLIKDKNFGEMVNVIEKLAMVDITSMATELYDNISKFAEPNDIPVVIKILSDYIDKATRSTNHKITCIAMYAEIMGNLE